MVRRSIVLVTGLLLIAPAIVHFGCSITEPSSTETSAEQPTAPPLQARSGSSAILVPDGDLTPYVGWPAYPGDPAEAWSKIDEGVDNLDIYDFIYAMDVGLVEWLTFTNLPTSGDAVVQELEFVIPITIGLDTAFSAGVELTYYIDGNAMGSETFQCGPVYGTECGSTTWIATFDDVCYTDTEINTLEIKIKSVGTRWSPQMTQIVIPAIDCRVSYDDAVVISNVVRSFNPMACEITTTWTTNVPSSSKVYWGFHPSQLINVVVGSGGTTSHSVTFDATGIPRKRVYIKAESAVGCDVAQSDTRFVFRNYCISQ